MKTGRTPMLLVAGLMMQGGPLLSDALQETDASTDRLRTEEILVSATRTERSVSEVPVSVAAVADYDLLKKPSQSVPDVLRDIPGVTVTDGGGAGMKFIRIRGESTRRTLYLVDGQPVSQQKSMQGGMPLIAKSQIERIEVVKGPSSVLYGSEAIGGVVNIITKKGGEKPFGGNVGFSYDTGNRGFRQDYGVHGNLDGLEYSLTYGRASYSDRKTATRRLDTDGSSIRDPSRPRISGSGSDIEDYSLYVGYRASRFHTGIRLSRHEIAYDIFTPRTTPTDAYMTLPRSRRDKISAFVEITDLTDHLEKVRLDAWRQETTRDHLIWTEFNFPFPPFFNYTSETRNHNEQLTHGGEIQTDWRFGDHTVILGATLTHDDIDGSTKTVRRTGTGPFPPGGDLRRYRYDAELLTAAAFLQDEWALTDATRLIGGVRFTYVNSSLNFTDDPDIVQSRASSSDTNPSFSLGAVHQATEHLTLRANYAQGYRHPNLVELYMGSPAHGGADPRQGNPNLSPETSQSFEVGALYADRSFSAEVALFYTEARDYITTDATRYINIGGADTLGAELALAYDIGDSGLTPYASGTWLRRKLEYGSGSAVSSTRDSGVAELSGRSGIRYGWDAPRLGFLTLDLFGRFSSSVDIEYSDGTRDAASGWSTANLEISLLTDRIFGFSGKRDVSCELYLGIYNLFDKDYTPFDERQAPGRHAVVGVNVTF